MQLLSFVVPVIGALVNDQPGPEVFVLTMRAALHTSNTPVALAIILFM